MKITKISATPLRVPITIDVLGLNRVVHFKICLVEIETTSGCVGFGMTGITNEEVVAAAINMVCPLNLKRKTTTPSLKKMASKSSLILKVLPC